MSHDAPITTSVLPATVKAVDRAVFAGCVILSLGAHALILGPCLPLLQKVAGRAPELSVAAELDAVPPEQMMLPGIDGGASAAVAWIGYEEYELHLARLSEAPQAAFAADAGAPGVIVEQGARSDQGGSAASAPSSRIDDSIPERGAPEGPRSHAASGNAGDGEELFSGDSSQPVSRDSPASGAQSPDAQTPGELSAPAPRLSPDETIRLLARLLHLDQPIGAPISRDDGAQPPARVEESATRPDPTVDEGDARAGPPNPAAAATASASGRGREGESADRDSIATSTEPITRSQMRSGKPVARAGLEVRPREPQFTTLMRLSILPRNPLVEVWFGPDGVPRRALIVRSSGHEGVDHAVEASLYRWRATGKALDGLRTDETVGISLTIVLNRGAGGG